jgi:hypothetical protein
MVLQLTTPFTFDPAKGNLLIDIVSPGANPGATGDFDYQFFTDNTTSAAASVSGSSTQPTGAFNLGGTRARTPDREYDLFPQRAFGGGWQSTLTYVNYSPVNVSCTTTFYGDSGAALQVPFGGAPASTRTDALAPGADLHQQTTADVTACRPGIWQARRRSRRATKKGDGVWPLFLLRISALKPRCVP